MQSRDTQRRAASSILLVLTLGTGPLYAQQQLPIDAIRAANASFDAALSARDIDAMEKLWSHDTNVAALHPRAKQLEVGWEAVRKSWEAAFARFTKLSVTMQEPIIRVHDGVATVTGIETVQAQRASGDAVSYAAFTTNVFEKSDGRWLMTLHHVTIVPKE